MIVTYLLYLLTFSHFTFTANMPPPLASAQELEIVLCRGGSKPRATVSLTLLQSEIHFDHYKCC